MLVYNIVAYKDSKPIEQTPWIAAAPSTLLTMTIVTTHSKGL